jgi:hypothetical protein
MTEITPEQQTKSPTCGTFDVLMEEIEPDHPVIGEDDIEFS